MPILLKIEVIAFCLLILLVVLYFVKKGKISVKYSFVWIFSIGIVFLTAIIPNFMEFIAKLLGFELLSNMMLTFLIVILLFITLSLTIIVSTQNEKIRLLIQELSILKGKNNE